MTKQITTDEFTRLMNRVAEAWNTGNARKAAECYTEDVVYLEPPDQLVYMG